MTINDEILAIANQIANQGQKPSVALIKTKLSQNVPLPKIISVLRTWQHQPEFTEIKHEARQTTSSSLDDKHNLEDIIARAIQPLKQEVAELKALIQQLIDKTD